MQVSNVKRTYQDPQNYQVTDQSSSALKTELFVQNILFETSEETLRDMFSKFGTVTKCKLVRDYYKRSKGRCFVEFETHKQALLALKEGNEMVVEGRKLYVEF